VKARPVARALKGLIVLRVDLVTIGNRPRLELDIASTLSNEQTADALKNASASFEERTRRVIAPPAPELVVVPGRGNGEPQ
jgi:hypothetical protein